MSMPGWYPDPSGAPGRFRFWDGSRWSTQTTADPYRAPAPNGSRTPRPSTSDRGWLIALAVLLAVTLIAVVAFLVFGTRNPQGGGATTDNDSSTPSVSGWDETSVPTSSDTGATVVVCPTASATTTTQQRSGKLTAGTLQVDQVPGWNSSDIGIGFAYDVHGQQSLVAQSTQHAWVNSLSVGRLPADDGFTDPQSAAKRAMDCFTSSDHYPGFLDRTDILSQTASIDGHPAWHIQTQVHVSMPDLPAIQGGVVDIVVVDLGAGLDPGIFLAAISIGDASGRQRVDAAMATLTVTG